LNTATHLSGAFGARTSLWSAIGNDFWGQIIRNHAKDLGISLRGLLSCNATAVCMVISGETDRGFLTYRGPIETLNIGRGGLEEASILESIQKHDHFHIAGYYNCPKLWDAPSANILRSARIKGATTSLNCQYDSTREWGHMDDVLPYVDFVFLNVDEALSISCGDTSNCSQDHIERCAQWFLDKGVTVAVITLGPKGALAMVTEEDHASEDDGRKKLRTLVQVGCTLTTPIPLVDTTGAGDAFISGFLSAFHEYFCDSEPTSPTHVGAITSSLRWGVASGCTCVGQFGASTPFDRQQVARLLPLDSQVTIKTI
jgi:sugar/nucleoside kinase (ribokinase family)